MAFEPLPQVPAPVARKTELEPFVRSVMLLLLAFVVLNIAREATYLIGSIQAFGTPRITNAAGLVRSLILVGAAITVASGLRRTENWARWATLIGGSLWALRLGFELFYLLKMRAAGYEQTEFQIMLLICMIWTLGAAVILLLTSKGRAAFSES